LMQFPVWISQESAVHASPSSQFFGVLSQAPVVGLHLEMVHALSQWQTLGVFTQAPSTHLSSVHGLLSLQSSPVKTHPLTGSQVEWKHLSWFAHEIGS
jgi:hypothetical protein